MNAIALLKADHRMIQALFDKLDKLEGKGRDKAKRALVEKLVRELSVHSAIEEEIFYPAVKMRIPGCAEEILKSLEEHGVMKWELYAISSIEPDDDRYDAKLAVLRDSTLHHIEEEENELFPRVKAAFDLTKLNQLGTALERAKKTAPTRPQPRAPDEPPANFVANLGAGVVDRARDAARAMMRRGERRAAVSRAASARAAARKEQRPVAGRGAAAAGKERLETARASRAKAPRATAARSKAPARAHAR
jgi:hemerythrin superfamily protein